MEVVFPSSLGVPVMKLLQEAQVEPNDIQRRINQTIHLQQTREEVHQRSQVLQEKLKKIFDKRTKAEDFYIGDKVLRWDSRRDDKGKQGKFNFLWKGPFIHPCIAREQYLLSEEPGWYRNRRRTSEWLNTETLL